MRFPQAFALHGIVGALYTIKRDLTPIFVSAYRPRAPIALTVLRGGKRRRHRQINGQWQRAG
ncbi:hypothetical protein HA40_11530 [Mixta calida]|nr:hypothetical protein HA40_11530 [Mixta calida]